MGVPVEQLNKIGEGSPHVVDRIRRGDVDLLINTPVGRGRAHGRLGDPARGGRARRPLHHDDDRRLRRRRRDRRRAVEPPPGALAPGAARRRRRARARAGARVARGRDRQGVTTFAQASPEEVEVGLAAPEPGPRTHAPFGRRLCTVTTNEAVGAYRLVGADDPAGRRRFPGSSTCLPRRRGGGAAPSQRPYLARAFSVCRALAARLEFLRRRDRPGDAKARGDSTPGEGVWLVGPLGIGFADPERLPATDGRRARAGRRRHRHRAARDLAAGARQARSRGRSLLGFRSAAQREAARLLGGRRRGRDRRRLARTPRTRDRSAGAGAGANAARQSSMPAVRRAMLEAVRRICAERAVPAQLALEEAMACGFGACFGCVVRTRTRIPADLRRRAGRRGGRPRRGLDRAMTPRSRSCRASRHGGRARRAAACASDPERVRHVRRDRGAAHIRRRRFASASLRRLRLQDDHARGPRAATRRRASGRPRPG